MRCEECGSGTSGFERGWRLVHAGDPEKGEVVLACYCPVCAHRELDDPGPEPPTQPIAGSAEGATSRMDFLIEFDPAGDDVVVKTAGVANANGFLRLNLALVADPRFRPGMNILVDHTALDTTKLSTTDLQEIATSFAAMRTRIGRSRIAFVVTDTAAAQQIDTAATHAQPIDAELRQFHSHADALAWLHPETPTPTST